MPPRILIVRIGATGDVLHALPAVSALRQALPEAHIGWAIEPVWLPLLRCESPIESKGNSPLINQIHLVPSRAWRQHPFAVSTRRQILNLRQNLRDAHYDLAVDLQGSLRSAIIARFATWNTAGPAAPREWPSHWFYKLKVPTRSPHVVPQAAEILSSATHLQLAPQPVDLPIDPAAEAWVNSLIPNGQSTIFLAPTAGWGAKEWPPERFGALAQALAQEGHTVLINATTHANPTAEAVAQASAGAAQVVHSTIPQLTSLLRRTALFIGGDTGPLHLAAALNTPVLALFGPTNPARNGPWISPENRQVLRHPSSLQSHKRTPATDPGLLQITVAEALTAARSLLRNPQ